MIHFMSLKNGLRNIGYSVWITRSNFELSILASFDWSIFEPFFHGRPKLTPCGHSDCQGLANPEKPNHFSSDLLNFSTL